MKSSSQHKSFCSVLHSAVLDLCREKYYTETIDWEVDGILCISLPDSKEQHVVKIHEKFPLDRTHNLPFDDGRCFACEKQCDVEEERERRDNDYQHNSEEEERYRDVSVIDLEHGIQPHNMVRTSPRGQQMEHISGRGEDLESENQTAFFSRSKRQENSNSTISSVPRIEKVISVKESFSNIPNEPLPPPPVDIGDEADYTVIKTEPDESEDFDLHMQCVNEEYNPNKTSDVREEAQQMQTEVKTEEVAFLLGSNVHSATSQNFDSSNTSSQAWGTRKHSLPSSTATISSINQPYPTASSSYDHSVKVSGNTMTLVKTPKMAAQNNVNNTSLSVPSTAAGNQSSTQQFKPLGKIFKHSKLTINRPIILGKHQQQTTKTEEESNVQDIADSFNSSNSGTEKMYKVNLGQQRNEMDNSFTIKSIDTTSIGHSLDPRRRHSCNVCGFATDRLYSLKRHMITHSKQYFYCEFCNARFNEMCKLRNHMREYHSLVQVYTAEK